MNEDRLLTVDEVPYKAISDLIPVDTTDKVVELFTRWTKNKVEVAQTQDAKTASIVIERVKVIFNNNPHRFSEDLMRKLGYDEACEAVIKELQ